MSFERDALLSQLEKLCPADDYCELLNNLNDMSDHQLKDLVGTFSETAYSPQAGSVEDPATSGAGG